MDEDIRVIFVPDIKLEDIVNSLSGSQTDRSEEEKYTIPYQYSKDSWIKQTNIRCMYCTLQHNNIPVFIPIYINSESNIPVTDKLFCSFPCAVSYVCKHYDDSSILLTNLATLYYIYTGVSISVDQLQTSPDPFKMNIYCGDGASEYTPETYRSTVNSLMSIRYI